MRAVHCDSITETDTMPVIAPVSLAYSSATTNVAHFTYAEDDFFLYVDASTVTTFIAKTRFIRECQFFITMSSLARDTLLELTVDITGFHISLPSREFPRLCLLVLQMRARYIVGRDFSVFDTLATAVHRFSGSRRLTIRFRLCLPFSEGVASSLAIWHPLDLALANCLRDQSLHLSVGCMAADA